MLGATCIREVRRPVETDESHEKGEDGRGDKHQPEKKKNASLKFGRVLNVRRDAYMEEVTPVNHSSKSLPLLRDHLLLLLLQVDLLLLLLLHHLQVLHSPPNLGKLTKLGSLHLSNVFGKLPVPHFQRSSLAMRTGRPCSFCPFYPGSFSSEVFAEKTSKAFLLHFPPSLALLQQHLFLVAALQPRDLAIHIWVVVTSYQGHPAERRCNKGIEGETLTEQKK